MQRQTLDDFINKALSVSDENIILLIGESSHSAKPSLPSLCKILMTNPALKDLKISLYIEHLDVMDNNVKYNIQQLNNAVMAEKVNEYEQIMFNALVNNNIDIYGLEIGSPLVGYSNAQELYQRFEQLHLPDLSERQKKFINEFVKENDVDSLKMSLDAIYAESNLRLQQFNVSALDIVKNTYKEGLCIVVVGGKHIPKLTSTQTQEITEEGLENRLNSIKPVFTTCIISSDEYAPKSNNPNFAFSVVANTCGMSADSAYVKTLPPVEKHGEKHTASLFSKKPEPQDKKNENNNPNNPSCNVM